MSAALYTEDGAYYARLSGGTVLCWRREGSAWTKQRGQLPDGSEQIGFAALPEELREEVLAVLARADAVQGPMDGHYN